jgi:hypothetical protein
LCRERYFTATPAEVLATDVYPGADTVTLTVTLVPASAGTSL